MMSILNDFMLKNLRCSECDKYLSVLPVKVYPNRVIKCGRCCTDNDGGTVSVYNKVARNCLFKCVNRHERCSKFLAVSEVVEHEKKCISGIYHCPKCEYKFSGFAYQLVLHYTDQHPRSIIKNGSFSLKVKRNFRERYLHIVKDYIFFVLVDNLAKDNILYLSTVSLIMHKNIKQWFFVKPLYNPIRGFLTEIKPCYSLEHFKCDYFNIRTNSITEITCKIHLDISEDINTVNQVSIIPRNIEINQLDLKSNCISSLCKIDKDIEPEPQLQKNISVSTSIQTVRVEDMFGIKLTDEFRKKYPGYELTPCGTALFKDILRTELACSNCKQLTGCNVFNCELGKHIVCWDCKAWCGICNTSINGWNEPLATINELLLLPCRWQCGEYFSGNHITQHELSCKKSSFSCPVCNSKCLNLEQLCRHLPAAHWNYENVTHFNLLGYLKDCKKQTNGKVSFFQNDYWFTMYWNRNQSVYEVVIESADNTELYELAIICDTDKKYNKIPGSIKFHLSDNPRFYLKRIRNS